MSNEGRIRISTTINSVVNLGSLSSGDSIPAPELVGVVKDDYDATKFKGLDEKPASDAYLRARQQGRRG